MKAKLIKQLVECHIRLTRGVKPAVEFEGDTVVLRVNVCQSVLSNIVLSSRADQQVLAVCERVVHKEYKKYQKVSKLEDFKFPEFIKLGTYAVLSSAGRWYYSSVMPERQENKWLTSPSMQIANNDIYVTKFPVVSPEDWGKVVLINREGWTEVIYNE